MSEENILIVKGILAEDTIIAGTQNYESDTICYILKKDIFKAILNGTLYIRDTPFVYKVYPINSLWNYIENKKDKLLNGLWKDPFIRNDPYFNKYIYWIENAMITGLFLQELENKLAKKQVIRQTIQNYEPLAYTTLYMYLKKFRNGNFVNLNLKKKEEKEDLETILRMYKVVSKYDLTKPLNFGDIYRELLMAILNKDYIDIKNELEMIKKYVIINKKAKLKRKKKIIQLINRRKEIDEKIEILKSIDPSNPEIQELEKEKKELEELLNKLTKRKKIIKENIQDEQEKAKEESKEIENKNGQ